MKLVSISEAAFMCGISAKTVERALKAGQLKRIKLGRRTLIPAAELDKLIQFGLPALEGSILCQ